MPIHHLLSIFFRVDGKRHNPDVHLLESLDVVLKISQLPIAVASPLSPVEEHDAPVPREARGDRHPIPPDEWGIDRWKWLVVFESHVVPPLCTLCLRPLQMGHASIYREIDSHDERGGPPPGFCQAC